MGHWLNWMNGDGGWLAVGFIGQGLFASRFIIQWLRSEAAGRSVIPLAFWYCSIAGGAVTLAYTIHLQSPPLILGQATPLLIYVRNVYLIFREKKRAQPQLDPSSSSG
ncbi:MAG TPA: lipid-A-disaccharide synthase N-terminal domain-containing protein [Micropepsaceae bacterium]|nr:lipid-A-disaccharide synthase N-terminal domain-containing protein [Micropepsaceae bacterium]